MKKHAVAKGVRMTQFVARLENAKKVRVLAAQVDLTAQCASHMSMTCRLSRNKYDT